VFRIAVRSKKKRRREGGKKGRREEGKKGREKGKKGGRKGRREKAVYMTGVGLVVFRFKSPPQAEKYFALKKKPDLRTQVYCSLGNR